MGRSYHKIAARELAEMMRTSKLHASSKAATLAFGPTAVLILLVGAAQAQSGNTVIQGPVVTVPGTHSSPWNIPNELMVGVSQGGTLIVESGGRVNGTTARLGNDNVTGTVTVIGHDSTWTNTGQIYIGVGAAGFGNLNILDGGQVSNTNVMVGHGAGATGTVAVSGSGSQWTNTGGLYIGHRGEGILNIDNGGRVSSAEGIVGDLVGSSGIVTVQNANSVWANTGNLILGYDGTGNLEIDSGGRVSARATIVGYTASGYGTLSLNGTAAAQGLLTTGQIVKGAGSAGVDLNGGILRATADQVDYLVGFASGDIEVGASGAFIDSNGHNIGISTALAGAGGLIKLGTGTLTLSGANTYSGGTAVNGGVLLVTSDANLGDASGPLSLDGGTLRFGSAFDLAATRAIALEAGGGTFDTGGFNSTISQNITGPGSLAKAGAGALTLTGTNTYTGGTAVNGGTLVIGAPEALASGPVSFGGGTLQFAYAGALDRPIDVSSGGFTADTNGNDQILSAPLTGSGPFTKTGSGRLSLTANNALTGATSVQQGHLTVNGSLTGSGVTVHSGASLGGNGTIGGLIVQSGGLATPGNSIGTLNVAGDITFEADSLYQVEVNAAGLSDRIIATGAATLNGGTVQVLAETGAYQPSTTYNVLTAAGGRTGTFSPDVTSNLAFLDPFLTYDANNVFLTLERKTDPAPVAFSSAAVSSNQYSTANAVEALGSGNPLFDAVVGQSVSGARQAFDVLSGEAHAAASTVTYSDSSLMRDAITRRLRQPVGSSPQTQGGNAGAYAADLPGAVPQPANGLWAEGFGAAGKMDPNGNAAGLETSTGGFILGADAQVSQNFQIGLAGGFVLTDWDVDERLSSGSNDSIHAAVYGSGSWGGLNLRLGTSYAWHHSDVSRIVTFPGFSDRTSASYDGWTAQAFGELGYEFTLGDVMLEPFVGASVLRLHTDGFAEKGGPAALTGYGQTQDLVTTTLGIRAEAQISEDLPLTVHGLLGWRHSHGEVNASAPLAFSEGSSAFNIAGAGIDRNVLLVGAGLDWQIDKDVALGVSYSGQIGERAQDHAVKGNFSWRF